MYSVLLWLVFDQQSAIHWSGLRYTKSQLWEILWKRSMLCFIGLFVWNRERRIRKKDRTFKFIRIACGISSVEIFSRPCGSHATTKQWQHSRTSGRYFRKSSASPIHGNNSVMSNAMNFQFKAGADKEEKVIKAGCLMQCRWYHHREPKKRCNLCWLGPRPRLSIHLTAAAAVGLLLPSRRRHRLPPISPAACCHIVCDLTSNPSAFGNLKLQYWCCVAFQLVECISGALMEKMNTTVSKSQVMSRSGSVF